MNTIKDQVAPKIQQSAQKTNEWQTVCPAYAAKRLMSASELSELAAKSFGGVV
ncbi:hypothetical protein HG263_21745 [Pseudoalteromonas sp. JBTF-M23]|uniref:Uncharacterized protein n=1 Tax=Pseudoalteromonas caenipelagi TaxID=2726988 RepID=A0A849VKF3_9GAMM|nr:hypothetical protein [Pseudoalteromonas caenipelagi]NOU53128.1 hypothetical protein [Pseudoalteromonas caenipelagi]